MERCSLAPSAMLQPLNQQSAINHMRYAISYPPYAIRRRRETMRLAVLADIHGNLPALEAVLADAQRQGVDGIIVAGDLTFGPQAGEATRLLQARGALMIRGNNDTHVLALASTPSGHPWRACRQFAALRWQHERLRSDGLAELAALPEERVVALPGTDAIRLVHGSPGGPAAPLLPNRDLVALRHMRAYGLREAESPPPLGQALACVEEPVLVCGHTHIAWAQRENGCLALNPGSVGAPLNGDARAQYALLAWQGGRWRAELRAVPYDLALLRAAFEESGLLAEGGAFARACLLWYESGRAVAMRLLEHAGRLAAEDGIACDDAVPDEIWDRAVATFDWPDAVAGLPLHE